MPGKAEWVRVGHGLLSRILRSTRFGRVQPHTCHLPRLLLHALGQTGRLQNRAGTIRAIQGYGFDRTTLQLKTVLEISHKALAFWIYQVNQEWLLMEYNLSKTGGQVLQMQKCMIQQNQNKALCINALRGEIFSLKKVLEEYKQKYNEVLERLNERNRQYQNLQGLLDSVWMHTLGTAEKDPISHPFTTGLVKQHSSPSSLGPENIKNVFQFSTPTRDRAQSFIKKN